MLRNRAGFTLAEVLVALVITAVIGAAATSAFVAQTRFFDRQEQVGEARSVSQGALNIMLAELRMIEPTGGIAAASDSSVTVNVPLALGVVCGNAGVLTVSRTPVDPTVFTDSAYTGYAWRDNAGVYSYVTSSTYPTLGTTSVCTMNRVQPDIAGDGGVIALTPTSAGAQPGMVVMMYGQIRYTFKASAMVPGRIGLYRFNTRHNVEEELVAPFDTTARFRFYVNDATSAVDAVPSPLSDLTGFELVLNSVSERPDPDGTFPTVPFRTSVFFKNR